MAKKLKVKNKAKAKTKVKVNNKNKNKISIVIDNSKKTLERSRNKNQQPSQNKQQPFTPIYIPQYQPTRPAYHQPTNIFNPYKESANIITAKKEEFKAPTIVSQAQETQTETATQDTGTETDSPAEIVTPNLETGVEERKNDEMEDERQTLINRANLLFDTYKSTGVKHLKRRKLENYSEKKLRNYIQELDEKIVKAVSPQKTRKKPSRVIIEPNEDYPEDPY